MRGYLCPLGQGTYVTLFFWLGCVPFLAVIPVHGNSFPQNKIANVCLSCYENVWVFDVFSLYSLGILFVFSLYSLCILSVFSLCPASFCLFFLEVCLQISSILGQFWLNFELQGVPGEALGTLCGTPVAQDPKKYVF